MDHVCNHNGENDDEEYVDPANVGNNDVTQFAL